MASLSCCGLKNAARTSYVLPTSSMSYALVRACTNFLRTQQAEERCKVHAYAQSWLCCMSRLRAEERRELRHRLVALRVSGVVIGLVREARVRRNALQCTGFLYACCGQGQIVRALLCACWMDLFVQPAQALHARDRVIHLVLLNVFQFVNVETFLVSFGDENEGYSELFSSGWIQPKARQAVHVTVADECVVANRRTGIARWICDVLRAGSDYFVSVVADGKRFGFCVASNKHGRVDGLWAWRIIERDVHSTEWIWLNICQVSEHDPFVIWRAIVKDREHVSVSRVWCRRRVPGDWFHCFQCVIHIEFFFRSAALSFCSALVSGDASMAQQWKIEFSRSVSLCKGVLVLHLGEL